MARMQDLIDAWLRGEREPPPIAKLVGFRLIECRDGFARLEMNTGQQHYNPMGTLHGGILCDIADSAMGLAFASTLLEDESFTTLELHIHYFRPVWESHLTAVGKTVKRGQRIGDTECEITDERGRLIAKASSTCMILRGDEAMGR